MPTTTLDGRSLSIPQVVALARDPAARLALDPAAVAALSRSRALVDAAIGRGQTIYGINTGFGKLANVRIANDQLDQLQINLIRSHAAGVGVPLPADVVRAAMLLRANVLLRPTSGVRPALVEALVALLNAGIVPRVPEQGSVGASGDLAPLSHIAHGADGRGGGAAARRARGVGVPPLHWRQLAWRPTASRPRKASASSTVPRPRPRCSPCWSHDAEVLWRTAVAAAAMSLEALRGTPTPLDPRIHAARPHPGQIRAAELMRELLDDERDPRIPSRQRPPGPGCLQPALHPAGARGGGRCDPLRRAKWP